MSRKARARDAVAPAWLVETVRPRRAPVLYGLMVRAALAVTVPLAAGFAAHKIALGLLPAIGALLATVVDIGGPYPARARRVASAALAGGAPGVVLGSLIHGMGWVAVVVLVAVAGQSRRSGTDRRPGRRGGCSPGNAPPTPGSTGRGRASASARWPASCAAAG